MHVYLWPRLLLVLLMAQGIGVHAWAVTVNLSSSHDFYNSGANITASASLSGLSSLSTFRSTGALADRYVYSFETWPEAANSLGGSSYAFKFDLDGNGSDDQQVTLTASSNVGTPALTKATNASAASPSTYVGGLGEIGWGSGSYAIHTFTFQKPVAAFGFAYRSAQNLDLKKAVGTQDYPVSYVLSDGTVVPLGSKGVSGGTISGNTNTFVGVVDNTGKGIVSFTVRIQGTSGSTSQFAFIDELAFRMIPQPAVAAIANLKASHDFQTLANITASASTSLPGLCSLSEFRAITELNRHVYSFTTWPQAANSLGSNAFSFRFDLNGDGTEDQRITVAASSNAATPTLTKATNASAASPSNYLGGTGDVGWNGSTYAAHTFTFQKAVSAFGFVYRSPGIIYLRKSVGTPTFPVSYTLSDGTVVSLGSSGAVGATIAANTNTFVGAIDSSGKGITSFTVRVQGSAGSASQAVYIDDLAFHVAGPPPGSWALTLNEEFNGTNLNTAIWWRNPRYKEIVNNELHGNVPENVTVANGVCSIKMEKRNVNNFNMNGWVATDANGNAIVQPYAGGAIQTYEKWTQTYGYFEARIKMPDARGTWPAFWLLPDRGPSYTNLGQRVEVGNVSGGVSIPMGNEFDVTEFMSAWKNASGLFTSHSGVFWKYRSAAAGGNLVRSDWARVNDGYGPGQYYYPDAATKFHTYGMYWGPGQAIFYIDGRRVWRYDGDPANIAVCPHYLVLNCAISTNFWIRTGTTAEIDADLATPKYMDIDYVKVWSGTLEP